MENTLRKSSTEVFNQHLSELILEVEGIKLRAEKSDVDGIKDHLERMNAILLEIMDARMDMAEKYHNVKN